MGIVDSKGSQVVVYRYDAWGEVLVSSDASGFSLSQINPLRYRGNYYDQETGLYYLQTRYYDPKVRRFLNADDASVLTKDPEQLREKNLYAYCDDNPVMYRDDAGMFVIAAAMVECGIKGLIGMAINVATVYFAAKVTGQKLGVGDFAIAALAGFVGGAISNNFYATLANALVSGIGIYYYSKSNGDTKEEALMKGAMTGICTAVSVNLLIGVNPELPIVVDKVVTTTFGIGNGLITAGVVSSLPYRKTSPKKNYTQSQKKTNTVLKNRTKKQRGKVWKHFVFKMNQLRYR